MTKASTSWISIAISSQQFNKHINYYSNYELDNTTTTWIKDVLLWWQIYIYHIYLCTTNIISGMYLVYKDIALMPLVVKKVITPTRKKATSPSFSHPGRQRQMSSQLILLLWVHRVHPILLQLPPLLSRWLLAPHLKFPPLLWHQLIAQWPSLKHPSLLLLLLLHLLLT